MSPRTRSGPPAISQLSIEYKLPLIIGGLLAAAIVAVAIAAYGEVRRTSLRLASERLTSVATQFRDLLRQQGGQLRTSASTLAAKPVVVQFAQTRDPKLHGEVLAALRAPASAPPQILADEIRDASGRVLLTTSPATTDLGTLTLDQMLGGGRSAPHDSAILGAFRLRRDTIIYPVAVPIPGAPDVYFVRWRRFASSQRSREAMNQLIGTNASLFVGNADGTLWSNLERAVAGPPINARNHTDRTTYDRDGEARVGAAVGVPGTPWMIAVDFPRKDVLAPVTSLTRRILFIAGLAFALSLGIGWWQLRQAHEARVQQERLAMLGQLSSGVGHELRNPLGVMTNAVYYLKTVLSDSPRSVHEYLDIIQQQVTLSEKIVSDLLDFARSKPPQRKPTPLREATESQVNRLRHNDGIRIETDIPDTMPPALVDPIQFGQIVLNLLTNATQALEGSGRISIRASMNGAKVIHYDVSDTGPGVPPENVDKIFEPLFTTKARGIGLGLSVSRMLARANGGDLTVRSVRGLGATFRVTLPIAESEALG